MDGRPGGAGALGPRLAGRLTAELILRSPQYLSAIKQYEIDLRANKIGAIENLGATENQFDAIDLSDNAIVRVEGFPKLPRLRTLLLANNKVSRVARGLEDTVPNLETLVLTNNRLANLADLDPLATLPKLTLLSLLGCPVATKPNYRAYVISKCRSLKVLDFRKVKPRERAEAARLFGDAAAAERHAAKTFEPAEELAAAAAAAATEASAAPSAAAAAAAPPPAASGPTPQQMLALKAAIANAATLEEVRRLEQALVSGTLPSEFLAARGAPPGGGGGPAAMEED